MSDEKFELSRRNALIGLGTVGVASAGAGVGTSAFFNDGEEFTGNSIQAGEFGLSVEQQVTGIDQDGIGGDEDDYDSGSEDGNVWVQNPITIEDAKPGDTYDFCWEFEVSDNPGHVAIAADSTDQTGSEAGNVNATDLWNVSDNSDLSSLGDVTVVDSVTLSGTDGTDVSYGYSNLGNLLSDLDNGVLLDDGGTAIQFDTGETYTLCISLSIPDTVGNELQGARLEWDMVIYAEQARHNDGSNTASNAASVLS